jgi:hypothetical protein
MIEMAETTATARAPLTQTTRQNDRNRRKAVAALLSVSAISATPADGIRLPSSPLHEPAEADGD